MGSRKSEVFVLYELYQLPSYVATSGNNPFGFKICVISKLK